MAKAAIVFIDSDSNQLNTKGEQGPYDVALHD